MNLLRKILIFSTFIIFQDTFGYICVNATSSYKMFGSVLRADVLKNPFIMAFQKEHFKNYKIFSADNDTQLVNQIQSMTNGQCTIILGLFTSQDCLVSGPTLKRNKTIGLSSSCSDDHITNFFPYVYTAVPRLTDFSKKVAEYVNHTGATERIYAFYQPSDVYSSSGFNAFKKSTHKPVIGIPVNSNGNFDLKILRNKKKDVSTIVFFTYPLPSAQILVSLDTDHLIAEKINIIGASSWIFDVSVFRPIKSILIKAKSVRTPSIIDQKRINSSEFAQEFIRLYQREPDIVEVLTYDMSRLAVRCYRNVLTRGGYSNESFLKCIQDNKYNGVSGHPEFEQNSPFSVRNLYLINFLSRI